MMLDVTTASSWDDMMEQLMEVTKTVQLNPKTNEIAAPGKGISNEGIFPTLNFKKNSPAYPLYF